MKKIAVFGCKTTTQFLLEALAGKYQISNLITIDENLGRKNKVADYIDLKETCGKIKHRFLPSRKLQFERCRRYKKHQRNGD